MQPKRDAQDLKIILFKLFFVGLSIWGIDISVEFLFPHAPGWTGDAAGSLTFAAWMVYLSFRHKNLLAVSHEKMSLLIAANAQYEALLKAFPDTIMIFNRAGQPVSYIAASGARCHALEQSSTALPAIAAQLQQLISPWLQDAFSAGPQSHQLEYERLGERIFLEARFQPQDDDQLLVLFRDMTQAHADHAALRQSEQSYRTLFEAAPIGIVLYTPDGMCLAANSTACAYGEFPANGLVGINFKTLSADPSDFDERVQALLAGARHNYHREVMTNSGEPLHLHLFESRCDLEGKPAILSFCLNVTEEVRAAQERVALQDRMLQAQKLESLGVLAGGLAHDFNNLLTGILGYASILSARRHSDLEDKAMLKHIETAAKRAAELCNQMLAYSGKGKFLIQDLNLSDTVREMVGMLRVSVSKKAALSLTLGENLPAMEADATQLRQVIMNLITNASDALGEAPGHITVTTGCVDVDAAYLRGMAIADQNITEGRYVFLEVIDDGCGMDEATRQKIFDPFFTTKFTGRGLGLAATLGIIRSHHGAIRVYSEFGKGTNFKVLFPALHQPLAAAPMQAGPAGAPARLRGKGNILVADDEMTVRVLLGELLTSMGFQVALACDGREALQLFGKRTEEFKLAILDLTMPELGGEEVMEELHRSGAGVPVLLTSGYSEQSLKHHAAGVLHAGFMQKPFMSGDLIAQLHAILPGALTEQI